MTQPSASTPLPPNQGSCVEEFLPHPLLRNPHIQTILATWYSGRVPALPARARLVALPDGDALVLHDSVPANWSAGGPAALLIHGLGGSHLSGYMHRVALRLLAGGVRAVRLDLRGCGRGERYARRTYNGACSTDVRHALAALAVWAPGSPVALVGFSLGGNIALKLAGETSQFPVANLECVAAVAPPIDMEKCAELLAQRRNRLYEWHFVRSLVGQVRRQEQHFAEMQRTRFPRRLSLRQFDDQFTAPRGGFRDALDYYRRASSLRLVSRIAVPTLIVTSRDDPFIAVEPFEEIEVGGAVQLHILRYGGHLGFLGNDGAGGVRWLEQRLVAWILKKPFRRAAAVLQE
jgi:predicted alpha/beta-fold hydrolase